MESAILDEYARLTDEKTALEQEITAVVDELTSGANAPGLKGPLVDADGFPRGDIDVYRVRHQRHAFAVKQNDHKAVMQRIEQILPQVFEAKANTARAAAAAGATAADTPPPAAASAVVASVAAVASPTRTAADASAPREIDAADRAKKPFAVVENVQNDSPAEWADLHAADQVLVFGTADATNHRELEAIKEIVLHNIGSPIRVVVRRPVHDTSSSGATQFAFHELRLTPQQWRGPGVLGCLLMPVRDTDEERERP